MLTVTPLTRLLLSDAIKNFTYILLINRQGLLSRYVAGNVEKYMYMRHVNNLRDHTHLTLTSVGKRANSNNSIVSVFRAQEPKAPVTYCDHALSGVRRPSSVVCRPSSVVRLSSVRLFTFSTSSPEPLDGF